MPQLAAFFSIWLTRLLPDEAEWRYDESDSAVATGRSSRRVEKPHPGSN